MTTSHSSLIVSDTTTRRTDVPIAIADLAPGMIIAESVYDRNDRLLASAGMAVTVRLQRQLQTLGIELVVIDAQTAPPTSPLAAMPFALAETATEIVEQTQTDPFMHALAYAARTRLDTRQRQAG